MDHLFKFFALVFVVAVAVNHPLTVVGLVIGLAVLKSVARAGAGSGSKSTR